MLSRFIRRSIEYDGKPLSSLWAYRTQGMQGDSIVAFTGPCHVDVNALVDLEDSLAGAEIHADNMLHFIVEHFDLDLPNMILRQRLLVAMIGEHLYKRKKASGLTRVGDDLFVGSGKLSVSIATLTPVSSKIHVGLNITNEGTPVKTSCLGQLGVDAVEFGKTMIKAYVTEHDQMRLARAKVRATD